jgi:hypothetical protein
MPGTVRHFLARYEGGHTPGRYGAVRTLNRMVPGP